ADAHVALAVGPGLRAALGFTRRRGRLAPWRPVGEVLLREPSPLEATGQPGRRLRDDAAGEEGAAHLACRPHGPARPACAGTAARSPGPPGAGVHGGSRRTRA